MAAELILGRYRPMGEAGSGGFATVQLAWDMRLQRKVAIKRLALSDVDVARASLPGNGVGSEELPDGRPKAIVLPWEEGENEAVERFDRTNPVYEVGDDDRWLSDVPGLDEARAVSNLIDANIVAMYDCQIEDNAAYLIMEYVEGITLGDLMRNHDEELNLDNIAAVFHSVAHALDVAHKNNVLHLDVKPDNILINAQGQVKVTDFGLATLVKNGERGVAVGGTIGYMPLEQMRRQELDGRCDEWALAAIAYELLVGKNPFSARDLPAAEAAIENAELVLPSICWEGLDAQIDDVLFYALDPDQENRYASVEDFAEEMEKFLGDPTIGKLQLAEIVADELAAQQHRTDLARNDAARAAAYSAGFNPDDYRDGGALAPFEGTASPKHRGLAALGGLLARKPKQPKSRSVASKRGRGAERDYEEYRDSRSGSGALDALRDKAGAAADAVGGAASQVGRRAAGLLSDQSKQIVSRLFALIVCGFLGGYAGYSLVPALGWPSSSFWLIALVCAVGGLAMPHIGMLLASIALSAALIMTDAIGLGIITLVLSGAWWFFIGRYGQAQSNNALAFPLLGAFGFAQVVPLATGYTLRPFQAVTSTVYGAYLNLLLAGLGSKSLVGWYILDHPMLTGPDVSAAMLELVKLPSTWAIILSWVLCALFVSLLCLPRRKTLSVIGCMLGFAILVAGVCVLALLQSGGATPIPEVRTVISTILAGAAMITVVCMDSPKKDDRRR